MFSAETSANATTLLPPEPIVNPSNPLLQEWKGPYGGVPPFDQVKVGDFEPAVDVAMSQCRDEIYAISHNKEKATFENTIVALEDSCRVLSRVLGMYHVWSSTMSTPEFQAIEEKLEPIQAAFFDQTINQNAHLFKRVEAVYRSPKLKKLTLEQQRLTQVVYDRFVFQGARVQGGEKARLAEINQELAGLYTKFSQNLLADENTWTVLESEADLAGLPDSDKAAAAAAAEERGLKGKWVIMNTRSSAEPFLTYSTRRDLREKVWNTFVGRGDTGGATDNNETIAKILRLRSERAKLLGFKSHAHWRLQDSMAGTPENAIALMESVWKPGVARVREEVAEQQAIADAEGSGITIAPWDYRFYMEKVRKARYDLDQNEVKPYLQLDKLREGMFWVAGQLYGLQFKEVSGLPIVQPDVRVWEVLDAKGEHVGLWYFDPYARPGKQSGAWMNEYRQQENFKGKVTTIVSNNSNFVKPAPGEPVLVSWEDANTLFHEFGHALHGLLSNVSYPTLAGTNVARDYVEFPSQLNEHWLGTPEVLSKFALHATTGEPIPDALVAKIKSTSTFNSGFGTMEYLASAMIDMKLHTSSEGVSDPDAFERDTLAALGMPPEIVMRHRTPQFAHIFSGDGYSAGYYSYLWADTLTADAAEAFEETGSMYDPASAERLRKYVLSVGNTIDPAEGFRAFRGRDVSRDALMRDRGFPVAPK